MELTEEKKITINEIIKDTKFQLDSVVDVIENSNIFELHIFLSEIEKLVHEIYYAVC